MLIVGNPHDNTECVTILLAPGVAFHPPRVVKIKFLVTVIIMWWPKIDCNIEEIVKTCKERTAQRGLPDHQLHHYIYS